MSLLECFSRKPEKTIEQRAPKGKTRVVRVKLIEPRTIRWVGDYDNRRMAFRIVGKYNEKRTGAMHDIYQAYNDRGQCVLGNANPDGPGYGP